MNRSGTSKSTIFLTGIALTAMLGAVYLTNPVHLRVFHYKTVDWVMAASAAPPSPASVVIVDIDENSLARLGQLPWPRYRIANLLQKISDKGASAVALTFILSEPDRTSPEIWQKMINSELGYRIEIENDSQAIIDHDAYLSETLKGCPCVLGFEFLFKENIADHPQCRMHPLTTVWVHPQKPAQPVIGLFNAIDVVCNLDLLSNSVSRSGFLNAMPDSDGILRRMPLLIGYEGHLYPSLALGARMRADNITQIQIRSGKTGARSLILKDTVIPMDAQSNILIDFNAWSNNIPRVSALDVLGDAAPTASFQNKIVLVGSSAAGSEHLYQTPYNPALSAAKIHACFLETLLTGKFVIRRHAFLLWEVIAGLLLAVGCCACVVRLGIFWSAVASLIAIIVLWHEARMVFQAKGLLLSPLFPTVAILVNYSVLTILKNWKDLGRARRSTNDALVLLRTSENQLNSIINTIPDIVFRLDANGRITFISPAITKYAKQIDKFLGRGIFDLVVPEDMEKAQYKINERRTGERATVDLELRLTLSQQPSQTEEDFRYFRVSAEGIYEQNGSDVLSFVGTQGIARDITEQKKLEDQLLQAQKMEAIGSLAAGVAHDLNNILSGLVSYPDLLLLDLPPDSPLRDKVTTIQRSGKKAAAIVQDLLTLARRGISAKEIFNLNRIVSDYLSSAESKRIREAHPEVALKIDLAKDLMNTSGSPVHFSKALMNMMINAAEAMPAGGCISVTTANRYLDAPAQGYELIPEGEYVCLNVTDEGIGISAKDIGRIFEPFYTKKSMLTSGSGLGMTVIWATVKDHGGYIDLRSKEGDGTSISIYLPATRDSVSSEGRRAVLQDYIGSERLLVVDDIPEQREIAVKMLTKLGYTVFSVSSGEKAEAFIESTEVDLVVLDMIMPGGIDGLETYRRLVSVRPGQKAIIASGFSESERVKSLQKLGAGAYVQKPYTLEKIGMAVRNEIDKKPI